MKINSRFRETKISLIFDKNQTKRKKATFDKGINVTY